LYVDVEYIKYTHPTRRIEMSKSTTLDASKLASSLFIFTETKMIFEYGKTTKKKGKFMFNLCMLERKSSIRISVGYGRFELLGTCQENG